MSQTSSRVRLESIDLLRGGCRAALSRGRRPSLLFLLMTLGMSLLFLRWADTGTPSEPSWSARQGDGRRILA